MEINFKMWKMAAIFAGLQALAIFASSWLVFKAPPTWFEISQVCVAPMITSAVGTFLQKCATPKTGGTS